MVRPFNRLGCWGCVIWLVLFFLLSYLVCLSKDSRGIDFSPEFLYSQQRVLSAVWRPYKVAPASSQCCCIFSCPSGSKTPIHLIWSSAQAGAMGRERCYTFSLTLMNRLNKTGCGIFILYFGLIALEGSTFQRNFDKEIANEQSNFKYDVCKLLSL